MNPQRIDLGNDIFLTVIPDSKFKTNYISLRFLSQLNNDTAALNALLPFVLIRGTSLCPDMTAMSRKLDMLYGSSVSPFVTKTGDIQVLGFSSYPLKSGYADNCDVNSGVLGHIGELLREPLMKDGTLLPKYIESEKRIMINRIQSKINDKGSYAMTRCYQLLCGDDPASIPETGTEEQVNAITSASLTSHLKTVISSYRVEIFAVGEFDIEKLKNDCLAIFVSVNRTSVLPIVDSAIQSKFNFKTVTEPQPVKQGKLCLGFRTSCTISSDTLAAYSVMTEVLANSQTSKLFTNVREKMGLCYYCFARTYLHKGLMQISSGIEVSDREKAQNAILEQINACKNGSISDFELDSAKKSIENDILSMSDDAGMIISWYFSRILAGIEDEPIDYLDRVRNVTADDVRRSANNLVLDTVYFLEGTLMQEDTDDE